MMNTMHTQSRETIDLSGVYANLGELIKLQYKARGFSFLPRQPINSVLAGRHASRLRGRGLNFEEIRRYQPGDDIRNIDWKVTARTQKTHTRVFNEERDRPVLLVVDQRLSMFFGSQVAMKSVTAAEAAALAAWRVISVGDRVGAVVFNDTEIVTIPPLRSRRRVMEILKAIVKQNHLLSVDADITPNPGMFNQALAMAQRLASHDYLVCCIGDFSGSDEETKQIMTLIARKNDVLVTFVYDPLEMELPQAGKVVVSDGKLQLSLDSNDLPLREQFTQGFQQQFIQGKDILLKQEVPVIPLNTSEGVAEQVRRALGRR